MTIQTAPRGIADTLVEVASALLRQKDGGVISMGDVCRVARISEGSFYRYFSSVAELLAKVEKSRS